MKSRNHLTMTGVISGLSVSPQIKIAHFVLIHNFGGGYPPIYMPCVARLDTLGACLTSKSPICIEANLRCVGGRTRAIVQKIQAN